MSMQYIVGHKKHTFFRFVLSVCQCGMAKWVSLSGFRWWMWFPSSLQVGLWRKSVAWSNSKGRQPSGSVLH